MREVPCIKSEPTTAKRVCILSVRNCKRHVSRCATYEFEDIVCQIDEVNLLNPNACKRSKSSRLFSKVKRRLGSDSFRSPYIVETNIHGKYDLFFMACQNLNDLGVLKAVRGWKIVWWVDESERFFSTGRQTSDCLGISYCGCPSG